MDHSIRLKTSTKHRHTIRSNVLGLKTVALNYRWRPIKLSDLKMSANQSFEGPYEEWVREKVGQSATILMVESAETLIIRPHYSKGRLIFEGSQLIQLVIKYLSVKSQPLFSRDIYEKSVKRRCTRPSENPPTALHTVYCLSQLWLKTEI